MSDIDLQDRGRTPNSFTCIESRVMCSLKLVKVLYISIAIYFKVNNKQNLTVICVLHFNKYTVSIRKSSRKKTGHEAYVKKIMKFMIVTTLYK